MEAKAMRVTLIQIFKRFYADYRKTSDVDTSFNSAKEALAYYVIDQTGVLADERDNDGIRGLIREFTEIRESTHGSNDSVKERFELEYSEEPAEAVLS
jgi:hypothetical protein